MATLNIDFTKKSGRVKPMHAVNNGPVYRFAASTRDNNIEEFREAGIPYARNHDASFYAAYGGEHTVDVHNIFTNFDNDPEDPASYDFAMTDEYVRVCEFAGVKTFYRLGSKIEHGIKKYGTLVPKDFKKWAVIAEHIVRHYTEGWADGFRYDMKYWEIWNEPDLGADRTTWGGTDEEFFEFYAVVYKHLKSCFPHLKIGGPACCKINDDWIVRFFDSLKKNGIKPDFFSWHRYRPTVEVVQENIRRIRRILDEYGFFETESILDEWNYVKGWNGEDWLYSLRTDKNHKGAAFVAAVMEMAQSEPVDMLMYYDARPSCMNGLFSTDIVSDKLKGYYSFYAFNKLYRLGTAVEAKSDTENLYVCAATNDTEAAVMLTHYSDEEKDAVDVSLSLSSLGADEGCEIEYYLLDQTHNLDLVFKATYYGDKFVPTLNMPNYTTYLIKVRKKV